MDFNWLHDQFLVAEDLETIEKFVEKIKNPEKKEFARILFYRIGARNVNETKNFDLFTRSLKEMVKQPIKDVIIKKRLLELLLGTKLILDDEVVKKLNGSNEAFDENKLKTSRYEDIKVPFRLYCRKFPKILMDKGLAQLKIEVDKTIANIKKNRGNNDQFLSTIVDSLAEELFLDEHIIKNANAYYEAIFHVLDSYRYVGYVGGLEFNYALCLLFLDSKGSRYPSIIERYQKQDISQWEKTLSTIDAIELFRKAYLQSPEKSESILKSLNEFFNSKASDYYDFLPDDKTQNLFDFITTEADKKTVLESYKQFNQKEKSK